jgi:hypothetical protein
MKAHLEGNMPRTHNHLASAASLLALASLTAPLVAVAATQPNPTLKRPQDGATYTGHHPGVSIAISGKSIEIIAFRTPCKDAKANSSLQDIDIKKRDRRYRFAIKAHSIITYSDNDKHPDENAAITLSGHFSPNAKKAFGTLRVNAPRCDTGKLTWSAQKD